MHVTFILVIVNVKLTVTEIIVGMFYLAAKVHLFDAHVVNPVVRKDNLCVGYVHFWYKQVSFRELIFNLCRCKEK